MLRIIFFVLLIFSISVFSEEIQFFSGSWSEVSAKAASENKLIFVDVFADWCAPCKWMSKNVFTNDSVGQFYNGSFINWAIDAEKGEGPDFARKYEVKFYPTFLYLNGKGELVHKVIGSMPVQDFISAGRSAADPELSLNSLKEKYKSGVREKAFLINYIKTLNSSYENTDEALNVYFSQLNENEIVTKENYDLISEMSSPNNDLFRYFVKNKDKFNSFQGDLNNDMLISYTYNSYISANAKKMSDSEFNTLLNDITDPVIQNELKITYYQSKKNWSEFIKYVDIFIDKHINAYENVVASQRLNGYAWAIHENASGSKTLKKGRSWAKKSVQLDENFYNTDTYASLLYKTGSKESALKYFRKSVSLGKKYGENTKTQEDMIKKIEKELDD